MEVSIRFKEIFNNLKATGVVKTQSDFAQKLKVDKHIVATVLQGRNNPSIDLLARLKEAFDVNMNFIFSKSTFMYVGVENIEPQRSYLLAIGIQQPRTLNESKVYKTAIL